MVPFFVKGEAVGTVWAIMHSNRRKFDAEDERIMMSAVRFASRAYQIQRPAEDFAVEIGAREEAQTKMRQLIGALESKVECLFASSIIGIVIWNLDGAIIEANAAFLGMTGHRRDDLVSGRMRWRELTPTEWREVDDHQIAVARTIGAVEPYVKEFFRKDGSRAQVLVRAAIFDRARNEGVAFVVDMTDLKRTEEAARESERRYQGTQLELLHANRLATMGQLSASIAHEVNQPIAAAITNAQTALRWLEVQPPNLAKAQQALGRILENGNRAIEVVSGIRSLIRKEAPRISRLDINSVVMEVIEFTRSEGAKSSVLVRTELAEGLSAIEGDRVQLQQVMLNLIVNAFEAMGPCSEGSCELRIATGKTECGGVIVAVQDSGLGVNPSDLERIFNAFYSTKPDGLGLGLSVCRAIIEAHGGKLWASTGAARGAIFQFTLPAHSDKAHDT